MSPDSDEVSGVVVVSRAPDDEAAREAWATQMVRVQVAMWVDEGAACAHCGRPYKSVDDFLARNPRRGHGPMPSFVDDACYPAYEEAGA